MVPGPRTTVDRKNAATASIGPSRAGAEWRSYWTLPIAAAVGNSTTVLHVYSLGSFMRPLHEALGWSRTEVSFGLTVANGAAALFYPAVGIIADRFGPRRVGLTGVVIMCTAIALLGTATGTLLNWTALWALVALGIISVQPTIWTGAVASRFNVSRGIALAVTLCGSAIAASVLPILSLFLVARYGWRAAFAGLGGIWLVLTLSVLLPFFRGAQDVRGAAPKVSAGQHGDSVGLSSADGFRSFSFYKMAISGALFSFAVMGVIVHLVPILEGKGLNAFDAAGIAGTVGISSLVARLGNGVLLDRFPAHRVAVAAFLLPVGVALLLLWSATMPWLIAAAVLVGASLGAELDVILYLASRHFGLRNYGVLVGALMTGMALGLSLGPVAAGAIFDHYGSYNPFLWLILPLVAAGAVLMGSLGSYPDFMALSKAAATKRL